MTKVEDVRRTSEIEDVTNLHIIHPAAARLVPLLAALRITPNAVSLAGMAFGMAAGIAYYHYARTEYAVAGFLLMIAWHVMDGADGQLARLTQSQSAFGQMLDGVCDYVTFIAVYAGLGLALARQSGPWAWALVVAAALCHAIQAAAYEAQRDSYERWGRGRTGRRGPGAAAQTGLFALFDRVYAAVQSLVSAMPEGASQKLAAASAGGPERAAAIRERYRETFAPSVRRWSVLSANYRTLGIFLAALLKAPFYYFWFEIVGFSAIFVVLLLGQRARYARFLASLP